MSIKDLITYVRDIIQISFFIIIAVITILSYLKAKKTILAPIRTEIFKEQLKIFSRILEMFTGKSEGNLREDFAFEELFVANSIKLLDDYAELFFDLEIDRENRPYNNIECPIKIVSEEEFEKKFKLVDNYIILGAGEEKKPKRPDPRTKAAIWNKYNYGIICIPKKLVEMRNKLQEIIDSPLLPKKCLELLLEYRKKIGKNIEILGNLLTELSQELPEKYTNLEEMKKAAIFWIRHEYVARFSPFEEISDEITKFLRGYFDVDALLE